MHYRTNNQIGNGGGCVVIDVYSRCKKVEGREERSEMVHILS
jgi:hypothetical protein